MIWHIGCSGFHYRDWKEFFYPSGLPQKKWFEFYSSQFDTLELNNTFYRFPQISILQNWFNISPAHYRFSVKAPRLITHYKQFNGCESLLDDFYNTVQEGLKGKLGAILFQLPPKFAYSPQRLELIIKNIRPGLNNAIEFRHPSWWNSEVYEAFEKENIIFTGISYPGLPDRPIQTYKTIYYRFHGIPDLYYSPYSQESLMNIVDALRNENAAEEIYVYFNNTATRAAIDNAQWMKEQLKDEKLTLNT